MEGEIFIFEVLFHISQDRAKMSSMYTFVLNLALSFTKTREDFQFLEISAQNMTDAGLCLQERPLSVGPTLGRFMD